jgi:hypothetical protein
MKHEEIRIASSGLNTVPVPFLGGGPFEIADTNVTEQIDHSLVGSRRLG